MGILGGHVYTLLTLFGLPYCIKNFRGGNVIFNASYGGYRPPTVSLFLIQEIMLEITNFTAHQNTEKVQARVKILKKSPIDSNHRALQNEYLIMGVLGV